MKICLDPGHGGKDRWNRGPNDYVEADGALDMALMTGNILVEHGIEVIYTRTTDANLYWEGKEWRDLRSRAKFANEQKVDYFISIHTNANPDSDANGTETFCLAKGGEGEKLAAAIQNSLVKDLGLKNRGVKEARFAVLRLTDMPAALTEVAFHSNPVEEKLLLDQDFRKKAAEAIAKGILGFLGIPFKKEKPWQQAAGEEAIDALAERSLLANAEQWKERDLIKESVPLWLFFEMMKRISG